ncbi:hypothetical protein ABES25_18775 [Bacillus gobiensis]|uniref:hypothetical protein n=1 Tax=Bacillus gobiensis TaxID=1441095 RepID=UPI003D24B125
MANIFIKEIHKNEDYFDLDYNPEVTISFASPDMSYMMAEAALQLMKPKKIIQNRDKVSLFYETFILSDYYNVKVIGGLTSGYDGSGVRAFQQLLETCGIPGKESDEYITSSQYTKAVLTVEVE